MPNKHISTIRIYRGQQEESSHAQGRIRTISGHSWWIDSSTQLLSGRWRSSRKRESDGIRPERRDKNQLKRIGYNGKNIRKKTRKKNEMSQLPFFFFLRKNVRNECFERSSLVRLAPTLGLSRPTAGSILKRCCCCCCCCGCASRGKIHQFFFHIFSTAKWEWLL